MKKITGLWPGVTISVLAAGVLLIPAVVYQLQHFCLGWHDVGNYTRANYNFFEFGRFAVASDGSDDFFVRQHFEPFFFLLCLPVRLFGTPGYVGAVTAALVLAAGYVFAIARAVTGSSWVAALCAAAYVVNPYTGAIGLSYHPETFGILFLLAFAYHNLRDQWARASLALLLAFTVKEDMWIYGVVVALVVARRDRLKQTVAFVAAALCYYAVAVLYIGGSWYPSANYFNTFYETAGHPQTKLQIALGLAARWREFVSLLFTGPGLLFQMSFLFLTVLGGWRYVLACGVTLLWLTYPGGPPRTSLSCYYSYAPLLMSFVVLPYGLANLRKWLARGGNGERRGRHAVSLAMGMVLAACVLMHVPGYTPASIRELVDYRMVFAQTHHVNVPVVRYVLSHVLPRDNESVLTQFYIFPSIPQRPRMYVTTNERDKFLTRHIEPKYVLLDLGSDDPWTPAEDTLAMARLLRLGGSYRPLYDASRVMLYERIR